MTEPAAKRLYWMKMRRLYSEIRVDRPNDRAAGSWTGNRALKYLPATGTFDDAMRWAIGTGNPVELRVEADQAAPDFTMLPDGRGKRGWM